MLMNLEFINIFLVVLSLSIRGCLADDIGTFNTVIQNGRDELARVSKAINASSSQNDENVDERIKLLMGVYQVLNHELDVGYGDTVRKAVFQKKIKAKHSCIANAAVESFSRFQTGLAKLQSKGAQLKENSVKNLQPYIHLVEKLDLFLVDYKNVKTEEIKEATPESVVKILEETVSFVKQVNETSIDIMQTVEKEKFIFFEGYVHIIHEAEASFKWTHANGLKKLSKCLV